MSGLRKSLALFGAVLAMVPLQVPQAVAQGAVPSERVEAFIEVMAQNNCRMNPHQADKLLPGAGFDDIAETKAITELLVAEERARVLDGTLVVFGGPCGDTLQYSGRERFFAGMADNNCRMNTDEARLILPRVGVEITEIQLLMGRMIDMGEVQLSSDERTVVLEQSLCDKFKGLSAKMAAAKPQGPASRSKQDLKADFVAFMKTVDCKMTRAQSQDMLPNAGFSGKTLRPIIAEMIEGGEAAMTGPDDLLTISDEVCGK